VAPVVARTPGSSSMIQTRHSTALPTAGSPRAP
jgi:hypothetical protein